jgi:hypothetical protein
VSVNVTFVEEKMWGFKYEFAHFSFVVPFTLTTVQVTNLALTQTKQINSVGGIDGGLPG